MRLASDPARLLAGSAGAYQDALVEAMTQLIGPEARDRIDAFLAGHFPDGEGQRGWFQLRAQLIRLQLQGLDAIATYQTELARRQVRDARHLIAVMEYRLVRVAPAGPGVLPWLWACPDQAAQDPVWGPYLKARQQLVHDQAAAVRERAAGWDAASAPGWVLPFLDDPGLVGELAVWRAAIGVSGSDLTPTGPKAGFADERKTQDRLQARVQRHIDQDRPGWKVPEQVSRDPYWQVVQLRLRAWAGAGYLVEPAIGQALDAGALPVQHPAAALWWRIETLLGEGIPGNTRPHVTGLAWRAALRDRLPDHVLQQATGSPGWQELEARLDQARLDGADEAGLVETAAALLPAGLEPDAVPAMLALRVQQLQQPPADPIEHLFDPEQTPPSLQLATTKPATPTTPAGSGEEPPPPVPAGAVPDRVGVFGPTSYRRIVELNQQAAVFYRDCYAGSSAAGYMRGRLGTDLLDQPGVVVGYAPAGGRLVQHLQQAGATPAELVDAGLAVQGRGGLRDRFSDRLILGLHNPEGDLVGFIGRARPNAPAGVPKYLNTPTTRAFTKGAILFGLHEYAGHIEQGAELVRTEGPLDALAITLATRGGAVGVAPLGTALTTVQAELIAAHRDVVWDATDTDAAGAAAAAKDLDRYNTAGLTAYRLLLIPPRLGPGPGQGPGRTVRKTRRAHTDPASPHPGPIRPHPGREHPPQPDHRTHRPTRRLGCEPAPPPDPASSPHHRPPRPRPVGGTHPPDSRPHRRRRRRHRPATRLAPRTRQDRSRRHRHPHPTTPSPRPPPPPHQTNPDGSAGGAEPGGDPCRRPSPPRNPATTNPATRPATPPPRRGSGADGCTVAGQGPVTGGN